MQCRTRVPGVPCTDPLLVSPPPYGVQYGACGKNSKRFRGSGQPKQRMSSTMSTETPQRSVWDQDRGCTHTARLVSPALFCSADRSQRAQTRPPRQCLPRRSDVGTPDNGDDSLYIFIVYESLYMGDIYIYIYIILFIYFCITSVR